MSISKARIVNNKLYIECEENCYNILPYYIYINGSEYEFEIEKIDKKEMVVLLKHQKLKRPSILLPSLDLVLNKVIYVTFSRNERNLVFSVIVQS